MMVKSDISILIADDHPLLLSGLYEELTVFGYNVVGKAENGTEALELLLELKPDIALLDIDMPYLTGFEVIKMAKEKGSKTHFMVLSFHKEIEYVTQAKALNIQGYLLKEDPFSEIEKCMESILNNKEYFSPSFDSNALINASEDIQKLKLLTPSEITILKLIAKQTSNNEISEILFVSVRTIEKHRSNIINKLEIDNHTNALTKWAFINKKIILEM